MKRLAREEAASPGPVHEEGYVTVRPEPFRGIFEYSSEQIAEEAELDPAEVHAALLALSTRFGECPADLRPRDENPVRRFPAIPIEEDLFFLPFLWNPLDEFIPWFLDFARARGEEKLAKRFLRARDDAAERLTREALAGVFGAEAVLGPLHYGVDGAEAELDCLVDAWPLCLVAEVKAHRVTDSAWRGAPDRVRRLDADLGKARTQASRAARFLREGEPVFRQPGSSQPLRLEEAPREIYRLAVSFEGVDPITFHGGLGVEPADRIWHVSLSDLLMATEILDDPASFAAYLEARTQLVGVPNFLSLMEVDLIGCFLGDRLTQQREMAASHPEAHLMLGYHGADVNRYFSNRDFGFSVEKPTAGVPAEVIEALRWMMRARDPEWHRVALAAMEADPEAWGGWKKQLRRARRGGRNSRDGGAFDFELPGGLEIAFLARKGGDCFDGIEETAAARPGALVIVERQGSPRRVRATSAPPDSQTGGS